MATTAVQATFEEAKRWRWLLAAAVVTVSAWDVFFLMAGPRLAISHDELNFLYDALRLPAEGRLSGYGHGPLLYELIALLEIGWYFMLRTTGGVVSPFQFVTHVVLNEHAHLVLGRALVGVIAVLLLLQIYRLGRLFGGDRVGALASVLCATNLTFITFASSLKEDVLFWLLLVTAMIQAWRVVEKSSGRGAFVCGFLVGAAIAAKYLGIFAVMLFALPMLVAARHERKRAIGNASMMVLGAGLAVSMLMPFIVTDRIQVLKSVLRESSKASWNDHLALPMYLFVHLPNLVGLPVLVAGFVGCWMFVKNDWRSPVILAVVPLAELCFLSARTGYSAAHYVFPLAIFLMIFAAAVADRALVRAPNKRWRLVILAAIACTVMFDSAYMRGSIKQALVLTAPDTRMRARDYLHANARSGECVVVTQGIVGMNFWGPPLASLEAPEGTGPFAVGSREALRVATGPRYHVRVTGPFSPVDEDVPRGCDWLVAVQLSPRGPLEFGGVPKKERFEPPSGFELATVVRGVPELQSGVWPQLVSLDYEELRDVSVRSLWRDRLRGHTLFVFRRASAEEPKR